MVRRFLGRLVPTAYGKTPLGTIGMSNRRSGSSSNVGPQTFNGLLPSTSIQHIQPLPAARSARSEPVFRQRIDPMAPAARCHPDQFADRPKGQTYDRAVEGIVATAWNRYSSESKAFGARNDHAYPTYGTSPKSVGDCVGHQGLRSINAE